MINSTSIKKQAFLLDMLKNSKPVHRIAAVLFIILTAGISFISFENEIAIYLLAVVAALPVLFLLPLYPRIWIYSVILVAPFFYYNSDEGVSVLDVLIGFYFGFFLMMWFIWQYGIKKEKLIQNGADWIIIFFFAVLPFNAVLAYMNGVMPIDWMREYVLYFIILYYFPIRKYFSGRVGLKQIIPVILLSILMGYIIHFSFYYSFMTSGIEYAYQLGKGVRSSTAMVLAGVLFALPFFFFSKSKKIKWILLLFNLVGIAAIVTTFARTIWALLILCIFILFFVVSFKQKISLIYLGVLSVVLITAGAYFYLGDKATIYYKVLEKRFESSAQGKQDASYKSRISEWSAVWEHIKDNPMGGNGLFKEFHFYNPIDEETARTSNIHNGYIFLTYRIGFPLTLCFLSFVIIYFYKALVFTINIKQNDDPLLKAASLGSFLVIFSMIAMNLTAALFVYRDGLFVMVYSVAILGIIETIRNNEKNSKKLSEQYG